MLTIVMHVFFLKQWYYDELHVITIGGNIPYLSTTCNSIHNILRGTVLWLLLCCTIGGTVPGHRTADVPQQCTEVVPEHNTANAPGLGNADASQHHRVNDPQH